jgi:hypothetical protein
MAAAVVFLAGCDKNKPYDTVVPPSEVHFTNNAGLSARYLPYYVSNDATSNYNVTVGATDVSSSDRTVTYKITSPSGAVAGTHYSIANAGTVTIPAGAATVDIPVHGIFAPYAAGTRKDTLIFTLSEPSMAPARFLDSVRLVLQRYCNVTLAGIEGVYTRTFEGTYGPYTSTVTNVTSTGATTATATLNNVYNSGITANNVVFNWTNPANFTISIPEQNTGLVGSGYQVWIRTSSGSGNTFSSCDQTIAFKIDLLAKTATGVLAGYFEQNYPISMAR